EGSLSQDADRIMNFELAAEQQALQGAAIKFARSELNSDMIERDADQIFSREAWQKCASFGVQGMPFPKEYGGQGADPLTTLAMMEGLVTAALIKGCSFRLMLTCGLVRSRSSNTA